MWRIHYCEVSWLDGVVLVVVMVMVVVMVTDKLKEEIADRVRIYARREQRACGESSIMDGRYMALERARLEKETLSSPASLCLRPGSCGRRVCQRSQRGFLISQSELS